MKSSRSFCSSSAVNVWPDCLSARYLANNSRERRSVSVQSPPPGTVFCSIVPLSSSSSGPSLVGFRPSFISSPSVVVSPSVSGLRTSVCHSSSSQSFKPSLSWSRERTATAFEACSGVTRLNVISERPLYINQTPPPIRSRRMMPILIFVRKVIVFLILPFLKGALESSKGGIFLNPPPRRLGTSLVYDYRLTGGIKTSIPNSSPYRGNEKILP